MRNFAKPLALATAILFICIAASKAAAQVAPSTTVPSGFGRYCSITYPDGAWGFVTLTGQNSDPCKEIRKGRPGGTIQRAGLWSTTGNNNVLLVCGGGVGIWRGTGSTVTALAAKDAQGKSNCIFTVGPTTLRVFSKPYFSNPFAEVARTTNPFDFNYYDKPLNATEFGQTKNNNCPNSMFIDRSGKQNCSTNGHGGYDWLMPTGTPMLAVADGIVRAARWRDVTAFGCKDKSPQGEIYVEHRIGNGEYAERFLVSYSHVSKISVKAGDRVTRGQVIGKSGDTGCSTAPHLHFGVFRLTNLAGHRSFSLTMPASGYGISGISGMIDPFGWNAPKDIDPWAWRFLGNHNDSILGTVRDPGAFSLYLWRAGQAPPAN